MKKPQKLKLGWQPGAGGLQGTKSCERMFKFFSVQNIKSNLRFEKRTQKFKSGCQPGAGGLQGTKGWRGRGVGGGYCPVTSASHHCPHFFFFPPLGNLFSTILSFQKHWKSIAIPSSVEAYCTLMICGQSIELIEIKDLRSARPCKQWDNKLLDQIDRQLDGCIFNLLTLWHQSVYIVELFTLLTLLDWTIF